MAAALPPRHAAIRAICGGGGGGAQDRNPVVRTWGEPRQAEKLPNHVDLVQMLDIVDLEKGAEVAGGRGYYLKGAVRENARTPPYTARLRVVRVPTGRLGVGVGVVQGVLLNMALINYALGFLTKRGFTPVQTPFFMRKECMSECAQLEDFDEQLYKARAAPRLFGSTQCSIVRVFACSRIVFETEMVGGVCGGAGAQVSGEGEEKYLIATSEQTLCSMLRKRWIHPKECPIRLAGYSTCFRKEARAAPHHHHHPTLTRARQRGPSMCECSSCVCDFWRVWRRGAGGVARARHAGHLPRAPVREGGAVLRHGAGRR